MPHSKNTPSKKVVQDDTLATTSSQPVPQEASASSYLAQEEKAEARLPSAPLTDSYGSTSRGSAKLENIPYAICDAAQNGHVKVFDGLIQLISPSQLQDLLAAENFVLYRQAARHGRLEIINRLVELVSRDRLEGMITTDNYCAFRDAPRYRLLRVLRRLCELVPNRLQSMLTYNDYEVFRLACGNTPMVNFLLHFPVIFKYAEIHQYDVIFKYAEIHQYDYLTPFINEELMALRARRETFEAKYPGKMFYLEKSDEAQLYFYMLRHLERYNDESTLDHISALLSIPAVCALVSTEVAADIPHDLIELAIAEKNQDAVTLPSSNQARRIEMLAAGPSSAPMSSLISTPKVSFTCEAYREAHPLARLIPASAWCSDLYFAQQLSESTMDLMQLKGPNDILEQLTAMRDLNVQEKECNWLAVAFSRKSIDTTFLHHIAQRLNFSAQQRLVLSTILGNFEFFQSCLIDDVMIAPSKMVFCSAAMHGHLDILECLVALIDPNILQGMMNQMLYYAVYNGHVKVFDYLIRLVAPDQLQDVLAAENYVLFRQAARHGRLDIINRLVKLVGRDRLEDMITADDFGAFRDASMGRHLSVMKCLCELIPNQLQSMLTYNDHEVFRLAYENNAMVNFLLHFPVIFAYARSHQHDVTPFIAEELKLLRLKQKTFEAQHPNNVFNLEDPDEAQVCFYMLKDLEERNNPSLWENDLWFLLSIPAIRRIIFREEAPDKPSYLMEWALIAEESQANSISLGSPLVTLPSSAQPSQIGMFASSSAAAGPSPSPKNTFTRDFMP